MFYPANAGKLLYINKTVAKYFCHLLLINNISRVYIYLGWSSSQHLALVSPFLALTCSSAQNAWQKDEGFMKNEAKQRLMCALETRSTTWFYQFLLHHLNFPKRCLPIHWAARYKSIRTCLKTVWPKAEMVQFVKRKKLCLQLLAYWSMQSTCAKKVALCMSLKCRDVIPCFQKTGRWRFANLANYITSQCI